MNEKLVPPGFPFVDGLRKTPPPEPPALPGRPPSARQDPSAYIPDEGLVQAMNVALLLGQPLLLTGEPGVGKTQLAHRLAWELGLDEPLVFNTKSSSVARDLFYRFDSLARFHAAHTGSASADPLDYLSYEALGKAVLWSHPPEDVRRWMPARLAHPGARRSVVLIDEIDKAPRDFTNDLLDQFPHIGVRIPELDGAELQAHPDRRPVLVLTSNLERNLPDAFLRRCVFFHIQPPTPERLEAIIERRLPELAGGALVASALKFYGQVRQLRLHKPPATAELLNFLVALAAWRAAPDQPLEASATALERSLSTLVKNAEDAEELARLVQQQFPARGR